MFKITLKILLPVFLRLLSTDLVFETFLHHDEMKFMVKNMLKAKIVTINDILVINHNHSSLVVFIDGNVPLCISDFNIVILADSLI